jgi:uncharacterized protein
MAGRVVRGDDSWFEGDYSEMFTGKHFYLMDPQPEAVCIEDIAHSLARTCRYGGHVHVENYSVAEHSCLIAEYDDGSDVLEKLLHDAGEAYYGDVKRPIKHEPAVAAVLDPIFKRVDEVVAGVFGIPVEPCASIKLLDRRIVRDEKDQVMSGRGPAPRLFYPPLGVKIRGLRPRDAEEWFLRIFRECTA